MLVNRVYPIVGAALHGDLARTDRLGATTGSEQGNEQASREGGGPEGDVRGSSHPRCSRPGTEAACAGRPRPLNLPDRLRAALAGKGKPIPFGSLALRNHLAVGEILRTDSGLRKHYTATKRRAGATAASIDEYGRGKNAGIQQILAAAGLTD